MLIDESGCSKMKRSYFCQVGVVLILLWSSVMLSAASNEQDGSLYLKTKRLENAQKRNTQQNDFYVKYGVELFQNNEASAYQQNKQKQAETARLLYNELFILEPGAKTESFNKNTLFSSSYKGNTLAKEAAAGKDNTYIFYIIIGVCLFVAGYMIVSMALKEEEV